MLQEVVQVTRRQMELKYSDRNCLQISSAKNLKREPVAIKFLSALLHMSLFCHKISAQNVKFKSGVMYNCTFLSSHLVVSHLLHSLQEQVAFSSCRLHYLS